MVKYAPFRDPDRRRAPRFPWTLDMMIVRAEGVDKVQTADVSLYGAFVRTDKPEAVDQLVRVRVREGMDDPIEWLGIVRRIVKSREATAEEPAGMGLEIFSIDKADWTRWTWLVAKVADRCEARYGPEQSRAEGPSASETPRRNPRFRTPVQVRISSMPELIRFGARDISAGGIFLRPAPPLKVGDEVELQIRHPLSGETFVIEARARRVEGDGVALEFIQLGTDERDRLKRFIVTGKRPR